MIDFSNILLAHGGGGQLMDQLLEQIVRPRISNSILEEGLDSGILDTGAGRLALTLDSYVVTPWQFPGGDIGRISICGTINDLAVCGAKPLGIALGLILAEGLDRAVLEQVMDSIAATARQAGVPIVTGDTKVVGKGQADGIFISTAGVGLIPDRPEKLGFAAVRPGDVLLINGTIADHGLAVMLAREMPQIQSPIRSDVAALNGLIAGILDSGMKVRFMRDPTRAGVSGLCADLATRTGRRVILDEQAIPVRPETRHAAEMLGLDVLEVANEGKVVMVVAPDDAPRTLAAMKAHPLGRDAAIIGRIGEQSDSMCELLTSSGGSRVVQKPYGEQLPRIC